ncbi:NUDIX hydrolase [Microbacterium sp. SORGH_AS_0888]|uniref:NUDIX domain-containing protein n=1 Tax=Microbacterium sp. SORGH_AS_0888 TaxID=3041791 RepID=UPI00278A392A|nr:NUDIX hydrolase [Microbacterium sp. SORGH_AS_0888]MDQ1129092.1 8-oxo-dGTP pyrophosphatase MutT (NUDIX family) [Microbacterium sp. SORGH_AS_0888]
MAWRTRATRTVYENRWIHVREDEVTGPHGDGIYGVVRMQHPAVFVVALDDEERVCLVRVDRYTVGPSWEVPAGGSDGEEPLVAARRELAEETGLAADEWTPLGSMTALNGIADAPEHVFLARGLREATDAAATQHEEGIDELAWVPFAEVVGMIADDRLTDGETIAAVAMAGIRLGRFA